MDKPKRKALMLRWAVLTAALTAIFWTVWHFTIGPVPVVCQTREFFQHDNLTLFYHISHWWDILFMFPSAMIMVWLATRKWPDVNHVKLLFFAGATTYIVVGFVYGFVHALASFLIQLLNILFVAIGLFSIVGLVMVVLSFAMLGLWWLLKFVGRTIKKVCTSIGKFYTDIGTPTKD